MFNFSKFVVKVVLLIACCYLQANAQLSKIQIVTATASNSTTVSATLTSTQANSLIVICSWWSTTGRTFTSITDNKGNTYTAVANTSNTNQVERIDFKAAAASGITTVTLTISGSSNDAIVVYEIAGADASPIDSSNIANSASATSVPVSLSTNFANEIVISGFCNGDTSADTAHDVSMTVDKDLNATSGGRFGAGSRIVSSTLSASDEGWTTAGAATAWAMVTASFKQAAVTGVCNNKIALMGAGCN